VTVQYSGASTIMTVSNQTAQAKAQLQPYASDVEDKVPTTRSTDISVAVLQPRPCRRAEFSKCRSVSPEH
jgi:hypothetical protein